MKRKIFYVVLSVTFLVSFYSAIYCVIENQNRTDTETEDSDTLDTKDSGTYYIDGVEYSFNPYTDDKIVCENIESGEYYLDKVQKNPKENFVKCELWKNKKCGGDMVIWWMDDGMVITELETLSYEY